MAAVWRNNKCTKDWHGIISSSLGGVMLLGSSTLIAIALVIDAELEPRKSPTAGLSSGMRGAIGLSWFMPALYAILTLLIYTIMGEWPSTWWMTVNTIGFVLFVIIEILFVILFSLLLYTLLHKLHFRAKKHDKHRYLTAKRYGLVYRITCLLVLKISTDTSYLIYSNSNEILCCYVFGLLSICLGFTLLICFVVKAERRLKSDVLNKSSSESPSNFYTDHGIIKKDATDCTAQAIQSAAKQKLPLAITTRRYPMECIQATTINDSYITTGGLCETTFLELNDATANLDVNFIEFKQSNQPLSHQQSQYPMLLDANSYDMEMVATDLALYSNGYKPATGACFLGDSGEFGGVTSLDILQGVRQDSSIIGIRSNYNVNDTLANANTNLSNLSALTVSTSNTMPNNPPQAQTTTFEPQHANQIKSVLDPSNTPQKNVETVNVHVAGADSEAGANASMKSIPNALPIITVTPTDESDNSIDGMLDRISLDLDYLLNRIADIPPPPQPPTAPIPIHKQLIHDVIIEEEPEDI